MLIKLTNAKGKLDLFLDAGIILAVHKTPNNLTETTILTSILTPTGPITFNVMETPEEVGWAVNTARSGKSPLIHSA
jgi:hypothetical protein